MGLSVQIHRVPSLTHSPLAKRVPAQEPSACIGQLELPIEALHRRGIDSTPLLRRFGLPVPSECDESVRVGEGALCDFWDACANASGEPSFGLCLGIESQRRPLPSLPLVLRQLVRHAGTLGEAIAHLIRFERLYEEGRRASLSIEGDRAVWTWKPAFGVRFSRAFSEHTLAYFARPEHWAHRNPGEPTLLEVHFPCEASAARAAYDAHFRVPLRFRCGEQALVFSRRSLEARSAHADTSLMPLLTRIAAADLAELPSVDRFADRVRAQLRRAGEAELLTTQLVARRLGTAERTLRRRLAEEDTSFSELVDEWRRDRARELLRDREMNLRKIAAALGYSEPNTFARAYRRWFGTSPAADRKDAIPRATLARHTFAPLARARA